MSHIEYIDAETVGGGRVRIAANLPGLCQHSDLAQAETWDDLPPEVECRSCGRRFSLEAAKAIVEMRS